MYPLMFRYIGLMVKNSLRNRRRSLLTIASIAASLCLLGVLMAMYKSLFMSDPTPTQALRLVTRHRVSLTQALPISYQQKIRNTPGVRDVMTWQWFGGTYKDNRDPKNFFARFATDPDHIFSVRNDFEIPDDQKLAFQRERTGCIVSKDLADKMGFHLGDRITIVGDIFPVTVDLKVVGIYQNPDKDEALYFNREYLRQALGASTDRANSTGAFQIQAQSADDVPRIAQAVDREFEASPYPTKTETEQQFALGFASFIGNLRLFIAAICAAVTFTILLVSGNTISMSVRERIREVGILKTLGFTPGAILGIILGESAVISLVGGFIGSLLAAALCFVVSHGPAASFNPALKALAITPVVGLACLGAALVIGLVSSVFPAWGASRTGILDALRYSG
jgi:putative ABC transport system permease protein